MLFNFVSFRSAFLPLSLLVFFCWAHALAGRWL
jgi:hypothetical protein